jgi:hypothetical protein
MAGGTILLLGGLNDRKRVAGGWDRGLAAAGLPHRREIVVWQQGGWSYLTLADLWSTKHHRSSAERLTDRIRRAEPPVHLMAHSAGTMVVALAVAALAESEAVQSIAFVGSALSPRFDLSSCLARCRYGLLSVESWLDCFHLGVGTTVAGTADRRFGPSAGMVGFRTAHPKLSTIRWSPRFVRLGWVGEHLTQSASGFAREVLAGWVRQAEGGVAEATDSATPARPRIM